MNPHSHAYLGKHAAREARETPFDNRDDAAYALGMAVADLEEPLKLFQGIPDGHGLTLDTQQIDSVITAINNAAKRIGHVVDVLHEGETGT